MERLAPTARPGTPAFRAALAKQEAALGLGGPAALARAEAAYQAAYNTLYWAEVHQQPAHVLDRFEAAYLTAMDAYTALWLQQHRTGAVPA